MKDNFEEVEDTALEAINLEGRVNPEVVRMMGMKVKDLRDWLEAKGLDRHITICLQTVGIMTWHRNKDGNIAVMMYKRPCDNGKLGPVGGICDPGETVKETAEREMFEEMGMKIPFNRLVPFEVCEKSHTYGNGDKTWKEAHRFTLELSEEEVQKIVGFCQTEAGLSDEQAGTVDVTLDDVDTANILDENNRNFVRTVLSTM